MWDDHLPQGLKLLHHQALALPGKQGLAYLGWDRGDHILDVAAKQLTGEGKKNVDAQSQCPGQFSQPGLKQSQSGR